MLKPRQCLISSILIRHPENSFSAPLKVRMKTAICRHFKKVDLKKVMHRIPDTASSMFSSEKRYRKYTTDEPENPSED